MDHNMKRHRHQAMQKAALELAMRGRFAPNVADVERVSNKMARVGQRINPLMEALGGLAVTCAVKHRP
jgi:hypothetical protein